MPGSPYTTYANFLSGRYGRTVYRVGVDAGFCCPHRTRPDGEPGAGESGAGGSDVADGCIYCDPSGSRAPYLGDLDDVRSQVRAGIRFVRSRYGAEGLALYFQANSSTNAPPAKLRAIYDAGLAEAPFLELIVATRPDCLDEGKVDLLASYRTRGLDVWVEMGLQSAHDRTLEMINRDHSVADFSRAYRLLRSRGINTAVHLIFGLPGEGRQDMMATIRFVAALRPQGVKIHNLHICRNTVLGRRHQLGEVTAPGSESHLRYVMEALELLPPATVAMRLTCDTPAERLQAPRHFSAKAAFLRDLVDRMLAEGRYQGRRFTVDPGIAMD